MVLIVGQTLAVATMLCLHINNLMLFAVKAMQLEKILIRQGSLVTEMKEYGRIMRHTFGDQDVNALHQLRAARVGMVHRLRDSRVNYVAALRFDPALGNACARHGAHAQENQRKEMLFQKTVVRVSK